MNIILVVTDSRGKSLVFATDTLKAYSLDDAMKRVEKDEWQSIHVVRSGAGSYIRANPNAVEKDNLDILSISSYKLFAAIDDLSAVAHLPGFRQYWKHYSAYLRSRQKKGEKLIRIGGRPLATHRDVVVTLRPHRQLILGAANHFSIDQRSYSQKKRTPNKTPRPTDRGVQIKNEFYPLATRILRKR